MKLVPWMICFAFMAAIGFGPRILSAQSSQLNISFEAKDNNSIVIKSDGRELMEYRAVESPNKAYVRQLFTRGGVQILRDSPDDHKHHHALMFAVKADNVDFWGEQPGAGIEKATWPFPVRAISRHDGIAEVDFTQKLDWFDPQSKKSIVLETRRIQTFASPELKATLLTWQSTLEPAEGKDSVVLGGDHYFGLGMRFVTSMDEAGEFVYADKKEGESIRGSEKLTAARWCAYRSTADGKPVTVAIFDSPANPRHPNKFFTMRPFAYLSATLNLWKEPMTLKAGQPFKLTYGVAAWDGHIDADEIEKTYQQWLKFEKK